MNRLLSLETVRTEHIPLSKSKLQRLMQTGELPTVRIGRRIFVTEEALREYIAGLPQVGSAS